MIKRPFKYRILFLNGIYNWTISLQDITSQSEYWTSPVARRTLYNILVRIEFLIDINIIKYPFFILIEFKSTFRVFFN
jgi:hypothetical protein